METNQSVPNGTIITCKKKNRLTVALFYDKMLSVSYTLENGDLDKEKIKQQTHSFSKDNE